MHTSTVTQKGQVTLPKEFRDKLNIKANNKVLFKLENNSITITPAPDIFEVAEQISKKVKVKIPVEEARDLFEKQYERI